MAEGSRVSVYRALVEFLKREAEVVENETKEWVQNFGLKQEHEDFIKSLKEALEAMEKALDSLLRLSLASQPAIGAGGPNKSRIPFEYIEV